MKADFLYYLNYPTIGTYQLQYDPDMSDEHSLIFARDMVYHGVQRRVGVNVRFIKDGYDFITTIYEQYGIEAEITFTVESLNKLTNTYETFFEGRLNLEAYKREEVFVTVGIEESGITQKFKSREDVKINLQSLTSLGDLVIPPFSSETVDVSMHSKTIAKKFVGGSNSEENDTLSVNESNSINPIPILDPFDTEQDFDLGRYCSVGINPEVNEIEGVSPFGTVFTTEEPAYIFKVVEPGRHTFNFDMDYVVKIEGYAINNIKLKDCDPYYSGGGLYDEAQISLIFKIVRGGVTYIETLVRHDEGTGCGLVSFTSDDAFTESYTHDLLVDDEIYIYFKYHSFSRFMRPTSASQVFLTMWSIDLRPQNIITINALTQSPIPTSTAKSLMWFEVGARISQSITDQPDAFRSTLFGRTDSEPFSYGSDGESSLMALTNGFQAREFPLSEKPIYASFKDWFQAGECILNIGVGIENNKVVVEKKSYFYNDTVIITLSNVANISKSVAKEFYYNEFENGFAKWENEEVNGLDEFNSKREWSLPITVIKNKLSKLSPYIGSGYAIEFTRRKTYEQTSTEDWKYDNDNFIVVVRRNGTSFEADRDQDFDSSEFANLLDPSTAYNLKISPKRSLKKWGYVLRSGLEKYLTKSVKFAFGEANYTMESKLTTEASTVVENENVVASDLETPLWLPEYYEFEAPITTASLTAMKANPYGVIEFSSGTTDYLRGFIINVKIDIENKKGTFKLLRANI